MSTPKKKVGLIDKLFEPLPPMAQDATRVVDPSTVPSRGGWREELRNVMPDDLKGMIATTLEADEARVEREIQSSTPYRGGPLDIFSPSKTRENKEERDKIIALKRENKLSSQPTIEPSQLSILEKIVPPEIRDIFRFSTTTEESPLVKGTKIAGEVIGIHDPLTMVEGPGAAFGPLLKKNMFSQLETVLKSKGSMHLADLRKAIDDVVINNTETVLPHHMVTDLMAHGLDDVLKSDITNYFNKLDAEHASAAGLDKLFDSDVYLPEQKFEDLGKTIGGSGWGYKPTNDEYGYSKKLPDGASLDIHVDPKSGKYKVYYGGSNEVIHETFNTEATALDYLVALETKEYPKAMLNVIGPTVTKLGWVKKQGYYQKSFRDGTSATIGVNPENNKYRVASVAGITSDVISKEFDNTTDALKYLNDIEPKAGDQLAITSGNSSYDDIAAKLDEYEIKEQFNKLEEVAEHTGFYSSVDSEGKDYIYKDFPNGTAISIDITPSGSYQVTYGTGQKIDTWIFNDQTEALNFAIDVELDQAALSKIPESPGTLDEMYEGELKAKQKADQDIINTEKAKTHLYKKPFSELSHAQGWVSPSNSEMKYKVVDGGYVSIVPLESGQFQINHPSIQGVTSKAFHSIEDATAYAKLAAKEIGNPKLLEFPIVPKATTTVTNRDQGNLNVIGQTLSEIGWKQAAKSINKSFANGDMGRITIDPLTHYYKLSIKDADGEILSSELFKDKISLIQGVFEHSANIASEYPSTVKSVDFGVEDKKKLQSVLDNDELSGWSDKGDGLFKEYEEGMGLISIDSNTGKYIFAFSNNDGDDGAELFENIDQLVSYLKWEEGFSPKEQFSHLLGEINKPKYNNKLENFSDDLEDMGWIDNNTQYSKDLSKGKADIFISPDTGIIHFVYSSNAGDVIEEFTNKEELLTFLKDDDTINEQFSFSQWKKKGQTPEYTETKPIKSLDKISNHFDSTWAEKVGSDGDKYYYKHLGIANDVTVSIQDNKYNIVHMDSGIIDHKTFESHVMAIKYLEKIDPSISYDATVNISKPPRQRRAKQAPISQQAIHSQASTPADIEINKKAQIANANTIPNSVTSAWEQVSGQEGSNKGGWFKPTTGPLAGNKVYAKFYKDPTQARGEYLSNQIYNKFGSKYSQSTAPDSYLFASEKGIGYAGVDIGVKKVIKSIDDVSPAEAREFLRNSHLDMLLGNWDVISYNWDNILIDHDGNIIRVDQGGSLLHRAMEISGRKPQSVLHTLDEWNKFPKTSSYQEMMQKAGYQDFDDLAPVLRERIGELPHDWAPFVNRHFADWDSPDKNDIIDMLNIRTDLLKQKAKGMDQRYFNKFVEKGLSEDPTWVKDDWPEWHKIMKSTMSVEGKAYFNGEYRDILRKQYPEFKELENMLSNWYSDSKPTKGALSQLTGIGLHRYKLAYRHEDYMEGARALLNAIDRESPNAPILWRGKHISDDQSAMEVDLLGVGDIIDYIPSSYSSNRQKGGDFMGGKRFILFELLPGSKSLRVGLMSNHSEWEWISGGKLEIVSERMEVDKYGNKEVRVLTVKQLETMNVQK